MLLLVANRGEPRLAMHDPTDKLEQTKLAERAQKEAAKAEREKHKSDKEDVSCEHSRRPAACVGCCQGVLQACGSCCAHTAISMGVPWPMRLCYRGEAWTAHHRTPAWTAPRPQERAIPSPLGWAHWAGPAALHWRKRCSAPQERLATAEALRIERAYFHPDSKRTHKEERVRPWACQQQRLLP